MNEFIVWDRTQKKFRCLSSVVFDTQGKFDINKNKINIKLINCWGSPFADNGEQNPDILVQRVPKHFSIHQYIGLNDRVNKKIYIDCSIVEYDYFIKEQHFNGVGFVTYNKNLCCYCIASLNGFKTTIAEAEQLSLLIIDTIQENKLGLIK